MEQLTKKSRTSRQRRLSKFKSQILHSGGQLLVEVLVAFGLASLLLPTIFSGFITGRSGKENDIQRMQALSLLKETEEAVRSYREAGWNAFAVNGTYHPVQNGSLWILSSGQEDLGDFKRSVAIEDAFRNESGDLVEAGGSNDPSTKKVTLTVSWGLLPVDSVSTTYYLTRYLENDTWTQTTKAEFDAGTKTGVAVTNINGGEIQLGAGGKADWCAPDPAKTVEFNLDKSGVANAISAIEGRVFVGTGDNASGPAFDNVGISNTDPPEASLLGNFGSNPVKTNGIFGEENYAYLATDTNRHQGIILDLTDPNGNYTEIGQLDPGAANVNGKSIYVAGDIAYLSATDGKIYSFNIAVRAGSHSPASSVDLGAVANKIVVVGNNIYAAMDISGANQLKIVPLTGGGLTFGAPVSVGVDGLAGRDIFVNSTGTRAYLATGDSSVKNELFIIDTDPLSGSYKAIRGSYSTSGMDPKGVTVVPGGRVIIVGTGGTQQYQVVDISNETSPVHCTSGGRSGGLFIASGVNGIASVLESDGDAYSYIIAGDASAELKIIEGGPGGKYSSSGIFESSVFDATSSAAFNRYLASYTAPNQTSVSFQFAGADAVSGSCSGSVFTFVGPDGTSGTKYASSSARIKFDNDGSDYENPARCFKYKVFLETLDPSVTPVFNDITINYTP